LREAAVEQLVREVEEKRQQLEERERKSVGREKELQAREQRVGEREEKWNETEKRMAQNAAKLSSVVHFNVSGTRFSVEKEKLLQHKGSLFEEMMVTNHSQFTPTGEIFINRDPELFKHISRYLVCGEQIPALQDNVKLQKELDYFKIPFGLPIQSELLDKTNFANTISAWIPNRRFKLLFKATVDGFSPADFHQHCDNKGPTLTIMLTNKGYLCGGYSANPWDSTSTFKTSAEAFIFTLSNPHRIPPTKYNCSVHIHSIYCSPSSGPVFGVNDIHPTPLLSNCISKFPVSYTDTTGKGNSTFAGYQCFTLSDIEVFLVY